MDKVQAAEQCLVPQQAQLLAVRMVLLLVVLLGVSLEASWARRKVAYLNKP
jgi:hypothetical protein